MIHSIAAVFGLSALFGGGLASGTPVSIPKPEASRPSKTARKSWWRKTQTPRRFVVPVVQMGLNQRQRRNLNRGRNAAGFRSAFASFLTLAALVGLCASSTSCGDFSAKDVLKTARGGLEIYRDFKEIRATK